MQQHSGILHKQNNSAQIKGGSNITLTEKWLDENCSQENITRKLRKLLKNQRWVDFLCRDESDCYVVYCNTYRQMREEAEMYDIPYVSSIYNEELALQIVKEFVFANADEIARWLGLPEKMYSAVYVGGKPIGIVKMKGETDFVPVFTALVTLKKSGYSNKNRSGFYVESIIPIPELPV